MDQAESGNAQLGIAQEHLASMPELHQNHVCSGLKNPAKLGRRCCFAVIPVCVCVYIYIYTYILYLQYSRLLYLQVIKPGSIFVGGKANQKDGLRGCDVQEDAMVFSQKFTVQFF